MELQRHLAAGATATQHVQAHAADDRGQPAGEVVHPGGPTTFKPQPGLLDGVVGLVGRTEHPVRDRPQTRTARLELLRQPPAARASSLTCHIVPLQDVTAMRPLIAEM